MYVAQLLQDIMRHTIDPDVLKGKSAVELLMQMVDAISSEDVGSAEAIIEAAQKGEETLVRLFLQVSDDFQLSH